MVQHTSVGDKGVSERSLLGHIVIQIRPSFSGTNEGVVHEYIGRQNIIKQLAGVGKCARYLNGSEEEKLPSYKIVMKEAKFENKGVNSLEGGEGPALFEQGGAELQCADTHLWEFGNQLHLLGLKNLLVPISYLQHLIYRYYV